MPSAVAGRQNVVTLSCHFIPRKAIFQLDDREYGRDTGSMYVRTIKVPSSKGGYNEYVRVVEAYREDGKVKQRVVADLGRKDVLLAVLPKLQRLLRGDIEPDESTPAELKV